MRKLEQIKTQKLDKINKESLDARSSNIMLAELLNRYPNFSQIFTDGSKFRKNVGCAVKKYRNKLIM